MMGDAPLLHIGLSPLLPIDRDFASLNLCSPHGYMGRGPDAKGPCKSNSADYNVFGSMERPLSLCRMLPQYTSVNVRPVYGRAIMRISRFMER